MIDGAVVSTVDPSSPCAPVPQAVTTVDEIIASASSWYTYCPNNLALERGREARPDARRLRRRALSDHAGAQDADRRTRRYLDNGRKKDKHIERQTKFLKGFGERVALNDRTCCAARSFTFDGLMRDVIEGDMGIPLSGDREVQREGQGADLQARRRADRDEPQAGAGIRASASATIAATSPAELADISCGGVGAMDWTIVVLRTPRGEEIFDRAAADGYASRCGRWTSSRHR